MVIKSIEVFGIPPDRFLPSHAKWYGEGMEGLWVTGYVSKARLDFYAKLHVETHTSLRYVIDRKDSICRFHQTWDEATFDFICDTLEQSRDCIDSIKKQINAFYLSGVI